MKYTSEFEYIKYINLESHLKYTSEFQKHASIQKLYFKYTSNFEYKFVSLESLLQVYFWPRKKIQMPFKNTYKVYLKYNSLLNSGWTQSILETYKFKLFFSVKNFGNQNISKGILEVYFIFRVQKYIWSKAQFQQDKILIKVYIIYGAIYTSRTYTSSLHWKYWFNFTKCVSSVLLLSK